MATYTQYTSYNEINDLERKDERSLNIKLDNLSIKSPEVVTSKHSEDETKKFTDYLELIVVTHGG